MTLLLVPGQPFPPGPSPFDSELLLDAGTFEYRTLHFPDIDVLNVNDWLIVEPKTISTFATTSVPAVT